MVRRLILGLFRKYTNMGKVKMLPPKTLFPQKMTVRCGGDMIPKTQYDLPISDKLKFPAVLKKNWEILPLFVTTGVSISIIFIAIVWAVFNKVDVVFTTHSRNNISRTMDLRRPTVHKMIIIEQKYKPWPEMAKSLARMKEEECNRILSGAVTSS